MDQKTYDELVLSLGMQIAELCIKLHWSYLIWTLSIDQQKDIVSFTLVTNDSEGHYLYLKLIGLMSYSQKPFSSLLLSAFLTNLTIMAKLDQAMKSDQTIGNPLELTAEQLHQFFLRS